ncbi:four helix bundle protein [candidate division KSB1 bacterium]|nr:four helix bundle protein [candidate division KSB1 bacterium]
MNTRKVESFDDLIVWQKSHAMVQTIYQATTKFPKKEQATIVPQLRDAAVQIPINIAIGFKKRVKKAKSFYYRNALVSIETVRYLIILSKDLGFIKDVEELTEHFETIERMLKRLIRSITS